MKYIELTKHNGRGFTLIELMVAIVIVAILVSIALPSYTDFLNKGRRSDAMSALMNAANLQEQFLLDRNTYSATIGGLGMSTLSDEGHYDLAVTAATAGCPINRCYVLTATPNANSPQASDADCTSFTLTSAGNKTATGARANECWRR